MCNSEFKLYRWELDNLGDWLWGYGVVIAKSKEEAFELLKKDITRGHEGYWLKMLVNTAELSKDNVKEIPINVTYVHTEVYSV